MTFFPPITRMVLRHASAVGCLLDRGELDEFQPDIAKELLCGHARIGGQVVAILANARAVIKGKPGEMPRIGGIIYTRAREGGVLHRERQPGADSLLFVQDVSGFMVGTEAEQSGIIRAGARFVEAMATAQVPKLVLTVNHASGAGYYAMAGRVRPRFHSELAHWADGGHGG